MLTRHGNGAGYGLRDWLLQRISAVFMLLYLVSLGITLALKQPLDYDAWKALFSQSWVRVPSALFWLILCLHVWVGMRDVLMDYVRLAGLRLLLEATTILLLVGYFMWAVQILWGI
jgi:succinate dehydrogenase / fumarate reductase, membrane anchor subunit